MRERHTLFAVLILLGACRPAYVLEDPNQVFVLQTNLRPNARGQMTSVLDWRGTEVLPLCTEVRIDDVGSREIRFTAIASGESYRYLLHRSTSLPVGEHIQRYFGDRCPVEVVDEVDAQGIQNGEVYGGMSREGVLLALGYPPEHRTPALEHDEWTYWGTEGPVRVIFSGDRVAAVEDPAGPHIAPRAVATPAARGEVASTGDSNVLVVEHGTGGATVVEDSTSPAPQATAPAPQPVAEQSPPNRPSRRARRRRRRRLRGVGRVAAGVAIGAAGQIRVQRRTTVTRRSGSNRSASNGSSQAPPEPTPSVTRREPVRAQLNDRCGRGQPACGRTMVCDARSSRCKYVTGSFPEAPHCTSDAQCPAGAICGVSQIQPDRGQLCWNEESNVVRR